MYCKKCGAELDDGWMFCNVCGADLSKDEIAPYPANAQDEASSKPRSVSLLAAVAAIVLLLAVVIGYMFWSQEQDRLSAERLTEVQDVYNGFKLQDDAIVVNTGKGANKIVLLQQYADLGNLRDSLESSIESGRLSLLDGTLYDVSSVRESIPGKMSAISDWVLSDYRMRLSSNSFKKTDTLSNLSKKKCNARLSALKKLKAELDNDVRIMGEDNGQTKEIISDIDKQTDKGKKILSKIKKRQKVKASKAKAERRKLEAKANGFIGTWAFEMLNGEVSPSLRFLEFYSDGRFYDKEEIIKTGRAPEPDEWKHTTATWKRVGGIKNGIVTISTSYGTRFYYHIDRHRITDSEGTTFAQR